LALLSLASWKTPCDGRAFFIARATFSTLTAHGRFFQKVQKGYDSDPLRQQIRDQEAKPVIPARKGMRQRRYDKVRYRLRNVVERFFNRIKHYRRVATRYDKTDPNYLGFLCLASLLTTILNVNTT
jgi:hypothetical protein